MAALAQALGDAGHGQGHAVDLGRVGLGDQGDAQRPARAGRRLGLRIGVAGELHGRDAAAPMRQFDDAATAGAIRTRHTTDTRVIALSRNAASMRRRAQPREDRHEATFCRNWPGNAGTTTATTTTAASTSRLHLLSALSFVAAYGLLFVDPALAAILAWCVSMTTRQAGHFFFEPRGYDHVNAATDEHKEADQGRLQHPAQDRADGGVGGRCRCCCGWRPRCSG